MIDRDFLKILACPETKQPLAEADAALVARVNEQIARGGLQNRGGQEVRDSLEAGLVRKDQRYLYPVRSGIPVLLVEEAIALS